MQASILWLIHLNISKKLWMILEYLDSKCSRGRLCTIIRVWAGGRERGKGGSSASPLRIKIVSSWPRCRYGRLGWFSSCGRESWGLLSFVAGLGSPLHFYWVSEREREHFCVLRRYSFHLSLLFWMVSSITTIPLLYFRGCMYVCKCVPAASLSHSLPSDQEKMIVSSDPRQECPPPLFLSCATSLFSKLFFILWLTRKECILNITCLR